MFGPEEKGKGKAKEREENVAQYTSVTFIADAAAESLKAGETFYTWQRGLPELRDALAAYHRRTYGMPMDADRITVTGAAEAEVVDFDVVTLPGTDHAAVVARLVLP